MNPKGPKMTILDLPHFANFLKITKHENRPAAIGTMPAYAAIWGIVLGISDPPSWAMSCMCPAFRPNQTRAHKTIGNIHNLRVLKLFFRKFKELIINLQVVQH